MYTVQPLDSIISLPVSAFTIVSTLGERALKGYLIACATQLLTHAHPTMHRICLVVLLFLLKPRLKGYNITNTYIVKHGY